MKFRWMFEDGYKVTIEAESVKDAAEAIRASGEAGQQITADLRAVLVAIESGEEPKEAKDVVDDLRERREQLARQSAS